MLNQFQLRASEIKAKRKASTSFENIESLKKTQQELVEKVINNLVETMLTKLETLAEDNKIENFAISMPVNFAKDYLIKSESFLSHKSKYDPYYQDDLYFEGEIMNQDAFINSVVDIFKTLEPSGEMFSIRAQCVVEKEKSVNCDRVEITVKLDDKAATKSISLQETEQSYKELQKIEKKLSSLSHSKKQAICRV